MNEERRLQEPVLNRSERSVIAFASIISGVILIYLALAGPLWLELIEYKTSTSAITQTEAQDLTNMVFLAPICIAAGVSLLLNKSYAKYFLILVPIYLIYVPLSYGIGMEWSNSVYSGNSEDYFLLFLFLVITGVITLMGSLAMFEDSDAPEFNTRNLKIYVTILYFFLLMMAFMWIGEVVEVIETGDTSSGSYSEAPTVFWVIRFFDLGFSIPLGFIAGYLLLTRPRKAYPLVLLFFGFFLTMSVAVNLMGWMMYLSEDPTLQVEGLFVFGALGGLSLLGYYYMMRDKISIGSIWNKIGAEHAHHPNQ